MSKKSRQQKQKLRILELEDLEESFDDDFDLDELSKDIYSTDWGNDWESDEGFSARRKIERRRDRQKLYSELDDFEGFGKYVD
jgi:hypothetical protein